MTFIYIYSICKLILGKIANFPKIADTLTKFFHTEHNEGPPDAEVEDTSLWGSLRAFLSEKKTH